MFHTARSVLLRPRPSGSNPILFVGNRLVQRGSTTESSPAAAAHPYPLQLISAHIDPSDPTAIILTTQPPASPTIRIKTNSAKMAAAEVRNYMQAINSATPNPLHYLVSPASSSSPSSRTSSLSPCLYPESVSEETPARILLNHGRPLHLLDPSHQAPSTALAFHLATAVLHLQKTKPKARPIGYFIAPFEGQDKTIVIYRIKSPTVDEYLLPCPPPVPLVLFTESSGGGGGDAGDSSEAELVPCLISQALDYVSQARTLFDSSFLALPDDLVFDSMLLQHTN